MPDQNQIIQPQHNSLAIAYKPSELLGIIASTSHSRKLKTLIQLMVKDYDIDYKKDNLPTDC